MSDFDTPEPPDDVLLVDSYRSTVEAFQLLTNAALLLDATDFTEAAGEVRHAKDRALAAVTTMTASLNGAARV